MFILRLNLTHPLKLAFLLVFTLWMGCDGYGVFYRGKKNIFNLISFCCLYLDKLIHFQNTVKFIFFHLYKSWNEYPHLKYSPYYHYVVQEIILRLHRKQIEKGQHGIWIRHEAHGCTYMHTDGKYCTDALL